MKTRLVLDHLVYAVPDLTAAIESFADHLGQAPQFGGRHVGLGTHNAILPLADECYVELIATDPDAEPPNHPRPFGLDTLAGRRLVTWAVRSRSIESDVERARAHGYDPGKILEMKRNTRSGALLEWKLTIQAKPFGDGILPFVIDWGQTPHPAYSDSRRPSDLALEAFSGGHPDRDSIQKSLDALNVNFKLDLLDEPSLMAHIRGPRGCMTLS